MANKTWGLRRLWAFAKINNSVALLISIIVLIKSTSSNRAADASPRAHAHGVTRLEGMADNRCSCLLFLLTALLLTITSISIVSGQSTGEWLIYDS